ncbi:hypothetical protein ACHAWF_015904 [Thalassiosira exigua]
MNPRRRRSALESERARLRSECTDLFDRKRAIEVRMEEVQARLMELDDLIDGSGAAGILGADEAEREDAEGGSEGVRVRAKEEEATPSAVDPAGDGPPAKLFEALDEADAATKRPSRRDETASATQPEDFLTDPRTQTQRPDEFLTDPTQEKRERGGDDERDDDFESNSEGTRRVSTSPPSLLEAVASETPPGRKRSAPAADGNGAAKGGATSSGRAAAVRNPYGPRSATRGEANPFQDLWDPHRSGEGPTAAAAGAAGTAIGGAARRGGAANTLEKYFVPTGSSARRDGAAAASGSDFVPALSYTKGAEAASGSERSSRPRDDDGDAARTEPGVERRPWTDRTMHHLRRTFGIARFRGHQREIVDATMSGRDAFVVMRTGGGKSLTYQLPAVLESEGDARKVTVVVSPLLSLIRDQEEQMNAYRRGSATSFTSGLEGGNSEHARRWNLVRDPDAGVALVFVTPEKVASSGRFKGEMERLNAEGRLGRFVIDECHCACQWGHDFRPDYVKLNILKHHFPEVPVLAVTVSCCFPFLVPKVAVGHLDGMGRGADAWPRSAGSAAGRAIEASAHEALHGRRWLLWEPPDHIRVMDMCPMSLYLVAWTGRLRWVTISAALVFVAGSLERPDFTRVPMDATASERVRHDCARMLKLGHNYRFFRSTANRPNLKYSVQSKADSKDGVVKDMVTFIKTNHVGEAGIIYTFSKKEADDVADRLCECGIVARSYHSGVKEARKNQIQRSWMRNNTQVVVATIAFGLGINKPDVRFVLHHSLSKTLEAYYQESGRAGRDGHPANCVLFYSPKDVTRMLGMIQYGQAHGDDALCRHFILTALGEAEDTMGNTFANLQQQCKTTIRRQVGAHCQTVARLVDELNTSGEACTINQIVTKWRSKTMDSDFSFLNDNPPGDLNKEECERIVVSLLLEDVFHPNIRYTAYSTIVYIVLGPKAPFLLTSPNPRAEMSFPVRPSQKQASSTNKAPLVATDEDGWISTKGKTNKAKPNPTKNKPKANKAKAKVTKKKPAKKTTRSKAKGKARTSKGAKKAGKKTGTQSKMLDIVEIDSSSSSSDDDMVLARRQSTKGQKKSMAGDLSDDLFDDDSEYEFSD